MTDRPPADANGTFSLAALMAAMMVELQAMHRDLVRLQDAVSPLVRGCPAVIGSERGLQAVEVLSHLPMGRAPPAGLQDLDRLSQIAAELSRLCEALAPCLASGGGNGCVAPALRVLTLKSLQHRLSGNAPVQDHDLPGRDEGEIWV